MYHQSNVFSVAVVACHILNQSTMQDVAEGGGDCGTPYKVGCRRFTSPLLPPLSMTQSNYASTAMAILHCFGLEDLAEQFLSENGVHVPSNMLSLSLQAHSFFDTLAIFFEQKQIEGVRYITYRSFRNSCLTHPQRHWYYVRGAKARHQRWIMVQASRHLNFDGHGLYVEFTGEEGVVPDPRLLGLHAACARVAHLSGAAEAFDELQRDAEDTKVLAFDGSSAPLLDNLLVPIALISGVA